MGDVLLSWAALGNAYEASAGPRQAQADTHSGGVSWLVVCVHQGPSLPAVVRFLGTSMRVSSSLAPGWPKGKEASDRAPGVCESLAPSGSQVCVCGYRGWSVHVYVCGVFCCCFYYLLHCT